MSSIKIARKIRFLPFFPYGYCSKQATAIEGRGNPYATMFRLGDDPDAVIQQCDNYRKRILDRSRYLCEKGYAKDTVRSCSTPRIDRTFRYLTKIGLAVMIEAPDEAALDQHEQASDDRPHNGKIKGDHFRASALSSTELRDTLCEYASSTDPASQTIFDELLLDAVTREKTTPLSYAINLVQEAKISLDKYSPNQVYNIWRLSHVNTMFLVNDHLTYLDRRPYNTGFAIDGITDPESFLAYTDKHGYTMAAITHYALTNWYSKNPGFYQITQTIPDESQSAKEAWLNTPAFYATRELPFFDEHASIKPDTAKGNMQTLRTIHIGLATGKKVNYLCYHGRTGTFKWLPKRELTAKTETEQAVRIMKTRCPEVTRRDTVDFALYFCTSLHQFTSLFARTLKKHIPGQKLSYITNTPFASIHAIPVNDSGTFLLWCLMEFSPIEAEQMIHKNLVANYGLTHATNRYYPLSYKGKRVFSGYTMDVSKINYALEDHLDGLDFYICCLPDQAPWYRKLFPGKTFL